eukprot:gnl/TRDRNA2_/TRDRNA2_167092_c1_seq4.p1 gnl/TRDRNA2_/TRDRNA2_167092_c1~~gnl/TRDRNA2_/TRDRNA2_167092_c1_seq4.p1  ORF type:complete len:105 (-),score=1.38 gnl/TRDRNA2_/TRDRNA2_167092_c1_seq4:10-324(-)
MKVCKQAIFAQSGSTRLHPPSNMRKQDLLHGMWLTTVRTAKVDVSLQIQKVIEYSHLLYLMSRVLVIAGLRIMWNSTGITSRNQQCLLLDCQHCQNNQQRYRTR